jgi:hypothetical protein
MNKKIAIFALVPFLAFLAMPVVAVHATSANTVIYAWCDNDGPSMSSGASATVAGHTAIVMCPPNGDKVQCTYIYLAGTAKFTGTSFVGGFHNSQKGSISPSYGGIEGYQSDTTGYNEAGWGIAGEAACTPCYC